MLEISTRPPSTGVSRLHTCALTALLLCIAWICPAQAAPDGAGLTARRRLAVLELTDTTGQQAAGASWLGETIRTRAARRMGDAWLLLTRENILAMLPPGVDLASCEGDCEVETGRNIGAHAVMTGTLAQVDGAWRVSLHLYDTASGALTRARQISARRLGALEAPLEVAVDALLDALPGALSAAEAHATEGPSLRQAGALHKKRLEASPYTPTSRWEKARPGLKVMTADQQGAEIYVDGALVGRTPLWLPGAGGTWRFEIRARDHHPLEVEAVAWGQGEAWMVQVPLSPAWDQIRVHSAIAGATVLIDGARVGEAPYTSAPLPPGLYRIKITHPCAPTPFEREVQVKGTEQTLDVYAALISRCGGLEIQSEPPGATVHAPFVGGDRVRTPHRFDQLPAGRFVVRVESEGYRSEQVAVEIEAGEITRLGLPLTPLFGEAEIVAEDHLHRPCGGYVLVDGQEVGRSPWRGKLQAGRRKISVGCGVAQDATGALTVMEGRRSAAALTADDRSVELEYRTDPVFGAHYFGVGGWFDERRPWRVRRGMGMDFGFQGFGPSGDPWAISGWSLGLYQSVAMPLGTPRVEAIGHLRLAVGGVSCTADAEAEGRCQRKEKDARDTLGLFSTRAGARVHLKALYVEGGWQLQLPFGAGDFELVSRHGPWLGAGWLF